VVTIDGAYDENEEAASGARVSRRKQFGSIGSSRAVASREGGVCPLEKMLWDVCIREIFSCSIECLSILRDLLHNEGPRRELP
jgi:hypothetical protein